MQVLWIADAAREFDIGERTLYRMVKDGQVSSYKRRGDRKTYLSRAQVNRAVGFQEVRAKYDP